MRRQAGPSLSLFGMKRVVLGATSGVRVCMVPVRWVVAVGWLVPLSAALILGCVSPLVTSARQDGLQAFQVSLRNAAQPLSNEQLVEVAHAVAERELVAMPAAAAVARVSEVSACIRDLEPTFQKLSRRTDSVGAITTQVLLDGGLLKTGRDRFVEDHENSSNPDWRAVAARSAVAEKHAEFRRSAFLDGDLRVRRAALRAARDARSPNDEAGLFEAARLDPDPIARKFALEALSVGAQSDTLARLRDIWPNADESLRKEIVLAWGRRDAFERGGQYQLSWVLTSSASIPRLAAAVVLLHASAEGITAGSSTAAPSTAAPVTLDAAFAEAILVDAFADGPVDEQEFVVKYAPRTRALVEAFVLGLRSSDEQKAVTAASVLVNGAAWRREANAKLTASLTSKNPHVARLAREALVAVRAPHVKDDLKSGLSAADPEVRLVAATQLLAYQREGQAGLGFEQLLADPDASVRNSLACSIMRQLGD
jgi:hypothetical protein